MDMPPLIAGILPDLATALDSAVARLKGASDEELYYAELFGYHVGKAKTDEPVKILSRLVEAEQQARVREFPAKLAEIKACVKELADAGGNQFRLDIKVRELTEAVAALTRPAPIGLDDDTAS